MTRKSCIRFLIHDDQGNTREVMKLSVAANQKDFYLFGKNKQIKVSFHFPSITGPGMKVLHVGPLINIPLFRDEQYQEGIVPVCAYVSKKDLHSYPINNARKDSECYYFLGDIRSFGDAFLIKVFHVQGDASEMNLNNLDQHSLLQPSDNNGNIQSDSIKPKMTILDFGQQSFYFDIIPIAKSGTSLDTEGLLIFEPGTARSMMSFIMNTSFPIIMDKPEFYKDGYSLHKNHANGCHFLNF